MEFTYIDHIVNEKKSAQIDIVTHEGIDEGFLTRIRMWANEVLDTTWGLSSLPRLTITIWKTKGELQAFYKKEKGSLGVVTGEEIEFLATHESWRGHPRIHLCQERLKGISDAVVRGSIHHEMGHAILHGKPDFYTFRYSNMLQKIATENGMDFPLLQHCVYFLSLAIKDQEVVQSLAEAGFDFGQLALLEYLISDTDEEYRSWELVKNSLGLKKIALSAFLKTLLPIEALFSVGIKGAHDLKSHWKQSYGWLSDKEQSNLSRITQDIMKIKGEAFQDRLEHVAVRLISDLSL